MSREWLKRRQKDTASRYAAREGYASRAACKLIAIDDRKRILRPGIRVLDLGAAPGGWSMVVARRILPGGTLLSADRRPFTPVPGGQQLIGDLTSPTVREQLHALCGAGLDVVLSDMAPHTSGHRQTDHWRAMELAELARGIATTTLVAGGTLLLKVFQGEDLRQWLMDLRTAFRNVVTIKPPASRQESPEMYVLATGWRGEAACA